VESRVGVMLIVQSIPHRTVLAIACISFVLFLGMMPCQASSTGESIEGVKDFHSNFIHHQEKSPVGQLVLPKDTVYFPWYGRDETGAKCTSCSAVPSGRPANEDIRMKGSESKEQVQDLRAINSVRQRDIVYEDVQKGEADPQGLSNSMDIQIAGELQKDRVSEEYGSFGDSIENLVNSRLTASMNGADSRDVGPSSGGALGNSMNIEVSGISVSAINTVEGGSAVANSNIVIKPVQIITAPAEVGEKLK
jgi:hypothetical protein